MNEYMKDGINATHTCMYVYDYIHTYIHAYAHAQAHVHIHMPFHLHVHIHAYIYVLDTDIMYACTYTGIHACVHSMHVCL